jgi:hypothetical protein
MIAVAGVLVFTLAAQGQNEPAETRVMPPPRAIPGITTDDQFPAACVDCHLNYREMGKDTRLSTIIGRWAEQVDPEILEVARAVAAPERPLRGAHPKVDISHQPIPEVCMDCHEDGTDNAIPLAPFLHKIHLAGPTETVFLSVFQGECTHCHKFDKARGEWRIPSAEEPATGALD